MLNKLFAVQAVVLSVLGFLATPVGALAKEQVLILGGAGKSGSAVAKQLIAKGHDVTVLVRPTTDRSRLKDVNVSYVVGDAMKPDEVAAALKGKKFSVIFDTIQIHPGGKDVKIVLTPDNSYTRIYENILPWAKQMGVKQFLSLGSGCGDREAKDCPLSPPLYRMAADLTNVEHLLRGSGVPYTIIRIGALIPSNPFHPDADLYSGQSVLSTDLSKFGAVLRADLDEQIVGCIGNEKCIGKIFVIDDPLVKPQLDHWLCKRSYETELVQGTEPRCGDMPRVTGARPRTQP